MDLSQEFIEANGLTEDQVGAINSHLSQEIVPNIKKEYDGLANKNAEGILDGASKAFTEKFGIDLQREKGEKYAEFIGRATEAALEKEKNALVEKEKEYNTKIKDFKGGEAYKEQIQALEAKNDSLLKQVADLEPLKGIDEKYAEATSRLTSMQKEIAYSGVKPVFPESVNKYEADAKWNQFKSGVEEKYNIEIKDGKAIAIDKGNVHKVVPLQDLLDKDENIAGLLKGREQKGLNGKPAATVAVDGLPFELPKGATSEEITKIVREHVLKKFDGNHVAPGFSKEFSELYAKAKAAKV